MMTLETCEADQWRERAGAGLSIIALIRGLKRERLGYPRNPCGVMVTTMVTNSAGWEGEGGTKQHQQPKKIQTNQYYPKQRGIEQNEVSNS